MRQIDNSHDGVMIILFHLKACQACCEKKGDEVARLDTRSMRIEIYRKERKKWIYEAFEADDEVELATLDVHFSVADAYEDVIFGEVD
jgi:Fe-S-cluster containining protein